MQENMQIMQKAAFEPMPRDTTPAAVPVALTTLSTETVVAIKTAMLEKIDATHRRMQNALGVRPDEASFLRRCEQRQAASLLEFMRAVKS
jgi:hypothetical protein